MTTPLFLLRCVQIGLSIRDLDLLTIGMVNDMYAESGNDDFKYRELASQEDMDNFYSDAFTDHYMAEQAKEAYAIHDGEQMTEWNVYFAKEIAKDKAKKAKKKK